MIDFLPFLVPRSGMAGQGRYLDGGTEERACVPGQRGMSGYVRERAKSATNGIRRGSVRW